MFNLNPCSPAVYLKFATWFCLTVVPTVVSNFVFDISLLQWPSMIKYSCWKPLFWPWQPPWLWQYTLCKAREITVPGGQGMYWSASFREIIKSLIGHNRACVRVCTESWILEKVLKFAAIFQTWKKSGKWR